MKCITCRIKIVKELANVAAKENFEMWLATCRSYVGAVTGVLVTNYSATSGTAFSLPPSLLLIRVKPRSSPTTAMIHGRKSRH